MSKITKRKLAVVFGGTGFLGQHIAHALVDADYEVRIADNRPYTGAKRGCEFVEADIVDRKSVDAAIEGADVVYNFAGIADIDEARDQPLQTAQVNVVGNINVMEAAYAAGAQRFLFASSVYVYSRSGSFYRASKQSAESFIEAFHERYGLPFTILRYGSLYGRGADPRNSIYRMVRQAMTEKSITYNGDQSAIREYIHVADAAQLSVKALAPEFANRHLILTGTERMPVKDIMQMIAEMLPDTVDLQFQEGNPDSHYVLTPYGFNPKLGHKLTANDFVDLGQGLLDCMDEAYAEFDHEPKSES
jgi:UDP-glucose 4-epimerase